MAHNCGESYQSQIKFTTINPPRYFGSFNQIETQNPILNLHLPEGTNNEYLFCGIFWINQLDRTSASSVKINVEE